MEYVNTVGSLYFICAINGLCNLASTKIITTFKKPIRLMHEHIRALIKLIYVHSIMYKCLYKSKIGKKCSLCSSRTIHIQQTNNSIKIEEWTSGWMLVKMHDCERGLCNVPYAPSMPTCQKHALIQYFSAFFKERMNLSLILHHSMMICHLYCADYVSGVYFACIGEHIVCAPPNRSLIIGITL